MSRVIYYVKLCDCVELNRNSFQMFNTNRTNHSVTRKALEHMTIITEKKRQLRKLLFTILFIIFI